MTQQGVPVHVPLSNAVTLAALEDALERRPIAPHSHLRLQFDLRRSTFIEAACLIRLIACTTQIFAEGGSVQFALPANRDVRDFLREWQFPQALREATGMPFIRLVRESDREYFGENEKGQHPSKYAGASIGPGMERLLSERFFSILTMRPRFAPSKVTAVMQEAGRWEKGLIAAVLQKHLNGPADYVPSRIIYESLTNALRHPNAEIVQTCSHFDDRAKFLTISLWDNGDSIVQTLRRPLSRGDSIRAAVPDDKHCEFLVKLAITQPPQFERIRSDYSPTAAVEDHLLLLASVFPGITRDPQGAETIANAALGSHPDLANPGMGLFILINAVVDVFGGSIAIRTANLFMNIKKPLPHDPRPVKYRAKLTSFRHQRQFLGNMLTIRLPLRRHRAKTRKITSDSTQAISAGEGSGHE